MGHCSGRTSSMISPFGALPNIPFLWPGTHKFSFFKHSAMQACCFVSAGMARSCSWSDLTALFLLRISYQMGKVQHPKTQSVWSQYFPVLAEEENIQSVIQWRCHPRLLPRKGELWHHGPYTIPLFRCRTCCSQRRGVALKRQLLSPCNWLGSPSEVNQRQEIVTAELLSDLLSLFIIRDDHVLCELHACACIHEI